MSQAQDHWEARPLTEGAPWPAELVGPGPLDAAEIEADLARPGYAPLRISCELESPVLGYGDGLHLDGFLSYGAWQVYRRLPDERRWWLPPIDGPWAVDFALPLARWSAPQVVSERVDPRLLTTAGEMWGWHASAVVCEWEGTDRRSFRGKPPGDEARRFSGARRMNTASGRFKGTDLAFEARWPRGGELVWYAFGDAERVRELLEHVPNIGKKHNLGCGTIARGLDGKPLWRVEEIDHDRSLVDPDTHTLARPMPFGYRGAESGVQCAVRAPYHHASRHVFCAPAGSPVDP